MSDFARSAGMATWWPQFWEDFMSETIMFMCTHAGEDPERATLPFIAGTIGAVSGQRAIVVTTIEGVRLGVAGGADGVQAEGHEPLQHHIETFIESGGELWLCSACTKPRGITEADVIEGATIVGAATVVELLTQGAKSISFG